ncbi:MAG: lactate utilization protein [Anaerolineaceae bacterium]
MVFTKPYLNTAFADLANEEQIERAVEALEKNGIRVFRAQNADEAREKLLELIPEGAEVFTSTSRTLESIDVLSDIDERYNSVRAQLAKMNPKTENRAMQKLGATPQYMVGSVHAVTEDGKVVVASNTGSQLAGYAASAEHVIWVVGAQKIVKDLDEAMQRIEEYAYPLENERAQQAYGINSHISKLLIVNKEANPNRTSMIIVDENLGF